MEKVPGQAVRVPTQVVVAACFARQTETVEEAQEASHVPVFLAPDALRQVDRKMVAVRVAQGIVVLMAVADRVLVDGSCGGVFKPIRHITTTMNTIFRLLAIGSSAIGATHCLLSHLIRQVSILLL